MNLIKKIVIRHCIPQRTNPKFSIYSTWWPHGFWYRISDQQNLDGDDRSFLLTPAKSKKMKHWLVILPGFKCILSYLNIKGRKSSNLANRKTCFMESWEDSLNKPMHLSKADIRQYQSWNNRDHSFTYHWNGNFHSLCINVISKELTIMYAKHKSMYPVASDCTTSCNRTIKK